jgi:hypothetical protein
MLGYTKRAVALPSLQQRTAVLYYAARHKRALNVNNLSIEVWPLSLVSLLRLPESSFPSLFEKYQDKQVNFLMVKLLTKTIYI